MVGRMEAVEFLVQGSEPEPYRVSVERYGAHIRAFCGCAAGIVGQSCKHKLSILRGCPDGVVSPNVSQVAVVSSWLHGSNIATALALLSEAEAAMDHAKKAVAAAKKHVGDAMRAPPP